MSSIKYTAKKGLKHLGSEVGSWLADADAESVTGGELVTDGDFPSMTNWTAVMGAEPCTASVVGGQLRFQASGATSNAVYVYQTLTGLDTTKKHVLSAEITQVVGNNSTTPLLHNPYIGTFNSTTTTKTVQTEFTPTASSHDVRLSIVAGMANGDIVDVDNVSVKLSDSDLSGVDHPLAYNGTITKAAVETGSTVMGYSGFSAANYFNRAYDGTLDFGTGDFSILGWIKTSGDGMIVDNRAVANVRGFSLEVASSVLRLRTRAASAESLTSGVISDFSAWTFVAATVSIIGTVHSLYVNGTLDNSATVTARDLTGGSDPLYVGLAGGFGTTPFPGSIALLRPCNTALTAAQIKNIYDSEKNLFKANSFFTQVGEEYSKDIDLSAATYSNKEVSNKSISLGGTQETVHVRTDIMRDIVIDGVHKDDLLEMRAFLQSVNAGETFDLDVYGTLASPDDVVTVIADPGFKEQRVNGNYFNIPMRLREV